MMKKGAVSLLTAVSLLVLPAVSYAEPDKTVSYEEKYKDHSIMYLLYKKEIVLKEDWSYAVKSHKIVRIQKEDGKSKGDIPVSYDKSTEKILNIKAYTITPDGKRHRYSRIHDVQVYEGMSMYSDSRLKIINMPEVTVGSIIDCEWTRRSTGDFPKHSFWLDEGLGFDDPVKEIIFSVKVPKKAGLRYQGFNMRYKPRLVEANGTVTYIWRIKDMDIDADSEDFMPPPAPDNIKNMFEFSTIKSWKDISDWYYKLCMTNLRSNRAIRKTVKEITAGMTTVKDKTRVILKYLQDNFRYVSMNIEGHAFEPHPTTEVFRNKYGDCKDLSLLGMCMLREAGIDSRIVLFNTEFSIIDPAKSLPIPTLFDHVLLEVEDKPGTFYIDPVLKGYDIGTYPGQYQGGYAFVITKDGGAFKRFPVLGHEKNYKRKDTKITIKEDGSAFYEGRTMWGLEDSRDIRRLWKNITNEDKERFNKALEDKLYSDSGALENRFENMDAEYEPLIGHYTFTRTKAYPITNGMMIIDLNGFGREGDFKEKDRKDDIFLPLNSLEEESYTYIIPEGFNISYIPKDVKLFIGFFEYQRTFTMKDRELTVTEKTCYNRTRFPKSRYKEVQDFFTKLTPETKQRIIIKKGSAWWRRVYNFLIPPKNNSC